MSTVDRQTAARLVRGDWPEDFQVYQKIWAYKNAWGGVSYKLAPEGYKLEDSAFTRSPRVVWVLGQSLGEFNSKAEQYEEEFLP